MNTWRLIIVAAIAIGLGFAMSRLIARRHAAITTAASSNPAHSGLDCTHAPDKDWHTFGGTFYQPGTTLYLINSQMCIGNEAGDEIGFLRVRVTNADFSKALFTYDNDEILRTEKIKLLNSVSPQLFIMTGAGGTGDEVDWEIIGESDGKLKEWAKPDYDHPAEKLLHPDEDFCCKDWNLHLVNDEIFLARGIYRRGEGNCCPSRGGVLVQLRAEPGNLKLASIRRISPREYHRWSYSPFCSRCTLQ